MNTILNKSFFFKLIYPNKFYREYMDRMPVELKRKIDLTYPWWNINKDINTLFKNN